jgi:hypothetical protein
MSDWGLLAWIRRRRGATLRSGGDPDDLAGSATRSTGADADLIHLEAGLAQPPGKITVRSS